MICQEPNCEAKLKSSEMKDGICSICKWIKMKNRKEDKIERK